MSQPERFKNVPPLRLNGEDFAEVGIHLMCVHLWGDDGEALNTFDMAEARKLRDWLNSTIPDEEGSPK